MRNESVTSIGLLLSRVLLGFVLAAHGWQKFTQWGIDGTAESFSEIGIPAAGLAAVVAAAIELVGGILLILGLGTRFVAAIEIVQMVLAGVLAGHFANGVFINDGGWELVGVIIAGCLALCAVGGGAIALDTFFKRGPRSATAEA